MLLEKTGQLIEEVTGGHGCNLPFSCLFKKYSEITEFSRKLPEGWDHSSVIQCFLSMSRAIDSVTSALYHGEVHVSRAALKTLAQLLS